MVLVCTEAPVARASHLVYRHLPGGGGGLWLHVRVHGAELRQGVSQVHQVVVQPLLQLQHLYLLHARAVHLVADLHTWVPRVMSFN